MRKINLGFLNCGFFLRFKIFGLLIILILFSISLLIRINHFNNVTGSQNLEATYHALLTIRAIDENPLENHWFLPTVSLSSALDKNISWGATVPTKTGDYIYTSFTPPGFIVPYLFFKSFNVAISEKNIALFNVMISILVSIILYLLLIEILQNTGYSGRVSMLGAIFGTIVSIFSREVLQSHGLVYWPHSLFQLLFVSSLFALFKFINKAQNSNTIKSGYLFLLVVLIFLCAWTEWTGYVFGMGLVIFFWFGFFLERRYKEVSILLILALFSAGIITIFHYGLVIGFEPMVKAFINRFFARSSTNGNFLSLMYGYILSFGIFLLLAFWGLIVYFWRGNTNDSNSINSKKSIFLFFVASIPLLENLIMLQHASVFSFDRLKLLFPLAIIFAISFARFSNYLRLVFFVLLLFASIQGYTSYISDLEKYAKWSDVDFKNKLLSNALNKSINIDCSVLLSNSVVRGYDNLLFNRGIYEHKTLVDSLGLIKKTGACNAIYFDRTSAFTDLMKYQNAVVTNKGGSSFSLEFIDMKNININFFLSDLNWNNGISKKWPGFLVPNTADLKSQLLSSDDIIFQDGDIRKILGVTAVGNYLHVHVDGTLLDYDKVGLPTTYILRKNSH
ncbi:hypothetical protein [Thorsellia anophelis]|uniref:Glycosyltransferase RgtA/B/C/D-like domain-containing protein n=1 Tax=Thorsellia anophelis DSM 18579 TaxID=1123402 RepID=A0A1I0FFP8_9GAMM|nr:hypothetical protein [Thorsellia anophelis]SET56812.1 hypothetical protein SAMN02583745_02750 [Thorsellia anophelis DSM 18579]